DRLADRVVRARGEAREMHPGDLAAARLAHLGADDRDLDLGALERELLGLLAGAHGQLDLGAGRALDPRRRLLRARAGDRLAVDLGDDVTLLQAAAGGRRALVDRDDLEPFVGRLHRHPDALEAPLGR